MKNCFIACGGTGAHVMLAMVRLHMLGYPFGFFEKKGKTFPDLFLVDQDSGDGKEQDLSTPWQEVKNLIRIHPGNHDTSKHFGRPDPPIRQDVTPLPVGENSDWYRPPNDQLKYKFKDSPILPLITSQAQREITYSLGMMASPAVGSLLFRLKEYDVKNGDPTKNWDRAYSDMLQDCKGRRMVICGSSVGGTGSSVAPTLARLCEEKEAEVMAIMVHKWFQFSRPDESEEKLDKSVERNKVMGENAAGGLASYGEELANKVTTVLVGVPDSRRILRQYTSDNQQPSSDSYAHAIGALAAIKYFLTTKDDEIKKGLYGVSASDTHYLTGDLIVESTPLRDIVGHAQVLTYLLEELSNVLKETSKEYPPEGRFFNFFIFADRVPTPAIVDWVYSEFKDRESLKQVANHLDFIRSSYQELLDWIFSLGLESRGDIHYENREVQEKGGEYFLSEKKCLDRIENHSLPKLQGSDSYSDKVEFVTLTLFHWLAKWIKDDWKKLKEKLNEKENSKKAKEGQGYWPDFDSKDDTGLLPKWGVPGELGKVSNDKINSTISYYFDRDHVTPNSWPHHVAVVEEYKFQIKNRNRSALHKLEMMLVGRACGILELKESETKHETSLLSHLIRDTHIATHRLIHPKSGKVFGFNSPETLLCPAPDVSNEDWNNLWKELTDPHWNFNWKNPTGIGDEKASDLSKHAVGHVRDKISSDDTQEKSIWENPTDWGEEREKARRCVRGWLKCVTSYIKENIPEKRSHWVGVLDEHLKTVEAGPFGVAEWLPLPGGKIKIPVPFDGDSIHLFENLSDEEREGGKKAGDVPKEIPEFGKVEISGKTFELIENFRLPGNNYETCAIWREHLDELQETGKFFAWKKDDTQRGGIWIRKRLSEDPVYIWDLQVISKENICIPTCIPLIQKSASRSGDEEILYPDLPLLPDYIDLLKIPKGKENEGEKCINHDRAWKALKQSGTVDRKRQMVSWDLDFMGRSDTINIPISTEGISPSRAHWMVWPNIKAVGGEQWHAYYVYENSPRLEAQTIYLDQDDHLSEPKKRPLGRSGHSHAVDFRDGQHRGGPPVALNAYDRKTKHDVGIYVVSLNEYSRDDNTWKLAIDFGTSHTVAAYEIRKPDSVKLNDQLLADDDGLSLHISKNYDAENLAEMDLDTWRPTYRKEKSDEITNALLPSDLWSFEKLNSVELEKFEDHWIPMTHYAIPVMRLQRSDLQEHIISGFKWEIDRGRFKGREQWLRKRYLRMAIEIFLADIAKQEGTLPKEIEMTFTYPLRGTTTQDTSNYGVIIEDVLEAGKVDLGTEFRLTPPKKGSKSTEEGMYSESHAAYDSTGDGFPILVKLVADLGGGTLDILIATHDIDTHKTESRKFGEVADSVKMGSDLLLKVLAENSEKYLPRDRGWESDKAFEQLRAWMRSIGSEKLFGTQSGNWQSSSLGLKGFEKTQEANDARDLINRYFGLITDFLARSLVAYVAKDVWPKLVSAASDREKLRLLVHLQGNGWRLWYGDRDYAGIQKEMEEKVKKRVIELWEDVGSQEVLIHDVWHPVGLIETSPKLEPIKHALGKSMSADDALKKSHRFPLSDVLLLSQGAEDRRKNWHDRLPFDGVGDARLSIQGFNPPLFMHDNSVARIEDALMREINESIKSSEMVRDRDKADAPIAALIWENALKSKNFRDG